MALLIDILVYGTPLVIAAGVLKYYGGKPPDPDNKKPEPEEDK